MAHSLTGKKVTVELPDGAMELIVNGRNISSKNEFGEWVGWNIVFVNTNDPDRESQGILMPKVVKP